MNVNDFPSFDNSYARLPARFYSHQTPDSVLNPASIRVNEVLAKNLGINPTWLASQEGVNFTSGNFVLEGATPIATAYAGHQFAGWNPQLGDGRALLLGEVIAFDKKRYDIQLKGSGRTLYSRGGDGRSPLGPVLREYIVSEAMASLGVPTTRALAAVTTGEGVQRDTELPGAVLARVARSHIRIGTVQYFAARQDYEALRILLDYVIQRHYPEAALTDRPFESLLIAIVERQATLVAQWQSLGFIHGVMNTDNVLLSGETIDYGPCAFMDGFNPNAVYSYIDRRGRYAYANQPRIAHWNLSQLAEAMLPVLDPDPDRALLLVQSAIDAFPDLFQSAYQRGMREKLGLYTEQPDDDVLIQDFLNVMAAENSDFTLSFRRLSDLVHPHTEREQIDSIFEFSAPFAEYLVGWRKRLSLESISAAQQQMQMDIVNPVYIPRNHLIEEAIQAAADREDFAPFHALVERLAKPGAFSAQQSAFALPPRAEQVVKNTFCGT